jgi:transposase-like protein
MLDRLNLSQIAKLFSDEEAAWLFLEELRWAHGPVCPHCGVVGRAYYLTPKEGERKTRTGRPSYRRLWKCADCREQFSVLVGTIFEDSKIPLSKWLMALHMMSASKNGVAALELSRTLGLAYRSAWFMCHRIRYAMQATAPEHTAPMSGIVEADETYVGGKGKRPGHPSGDKVPVFALVQRGRGVRAQVMPRVSRHTVRTALQEQTIPAQTVLMTDQAAHFITPGREMGWHETVDHSEKEYVRGQAHTNTAEGFFSQLQRSIDGTHHSVSPEHLHRYVTEYEFRYNARKMKDGERTALLVEQTAGKRLTYRAAANAPVD